MKSSRGPVKYVIGCSTHPVIILVYTKENHGVWGPQKMYVKAYIIHEYVQRVSQCERQKMSSCREKQGSHDKKMLLS